MFQLRQIRVWWRKSQEGNDWNSLETLFLFSSHATSHHSQGCSSETTENSSCVADGGADWLFRCTLDIFGTVYTCFTIMSRAKQQQGSCVTFHWLTCFSSLSLHLYACVRMKAVCMWHGQTRTKWIHWRSESGSEETERGRKQALQYGPGENCTGTYIICACMCECAHKCQMGFCGHIYQDVSYFHCACLPGGYQASISNAAL